jgi:hypothetical protein
VFMGVNVEYVNSVVCIPFVHDHFVTTLSNNELNFRFQFVRGSGD